MSQGESAPLGKEEVLFRHLSKRRFSDGVHLSSDLFLPRLRDNGMASVDVSAGRSAPDARQVFDAFTAYKTKSITVTAVVSCGVGAFSSPSNRNRHHGHIDFTRLEPDKWDEVALRLKDKSVWAP